MNSEERIYLSRVAELGCVVCRNQLLGDTPAQIHYILKGQGTSLRNDPYRTLPLCHLHGWTGGYGTAIRAGRRQWEKNYGTEEELLAQVRRELGVDCA